MKKLLKSLFPRTFLKYAFGLYNRFKIATVDKLIFPEQGIQKSEFKLYREDNPLLQSNINLGEIEDPDIRHYMTYWVNWTQEEFILRYDLPCLIEPRFGWALTKGTHLLYYSLGISRTWFQGKPGLMRFIFKKEVQELECVISLRDTGEENYFHFYNDVLAKIYFLEKNGIDVRNTPVVVSEKLWKREYFQSYLQQSPLFKSLHWIRQEKQYIRCRHAIFCKPLTHRKDLYESIFEPLRIDTPGDTIKLFIYRSKKHQRFLENEAEVEELCKKFGFVVQDTEGMQLLNQIRLFSRASVILGVHGAGLTNMYFRNGPCKVIEIFPPPSENYLPFHYMLLADLKSFSYEAIIGEEGKHFSDGFRIDPEKLAIKIRKAVDDTADYSR